MSCIEKIFKASDSIKLNFEEHYIDTGKEDLDFDGKYTDFSGKSGIMFTDEICGLYRKNSNIKISWARRKHLENLYGCFEMIPLEDIIPMHEDMIETGKSALEYAETGEEKKNAEKLDILNYMYPVLAFESGDALCIHSKTKQIVLFNHDVFELDDLDINGLVIADSFDDLIDKWSMILFLEAFWWESEYDRCVNAHGIDLNNEYFKSLRIL